jgi:hypothetical protein
MCILRFGQVRIPCPETSTNQAPSRWIAGARSGPQPYARDRLDEDTEMAACCGGLGRITQPASQPPEENEATWNQCVQLAGVFTPPQKYCKAFRTAAPSKTEA